MTERSTQIEFIPKDGTYVLETRIIESNAEAFISVDEAIQKKINESARDGLKSLGYFGGAFAGMAAGILIVIAGSAETAQNVNSDHAATIAAGLQLFILGALSFKQFIGEPYHSEILDSQLKEIKKAKKRRRKKGSKTS